jgi:DNA-directed RNA polymerase specialized sigma24 family protein
MHPGFTPDGAATGSFPSTRWSLIVQAAAPATPQARQALGELCSLYWYPVYAFIRRKGNDPDRALDLTQDFFARLLEKEILASVDQGNGRFRSFLRVVCSNFLVDTVRKKKLDVASNSISIDARDAEGRYRVEPADQLTPDRLFDRVWALTLLDRVLGLLAAEYAGSGRAELFHEIKVVLTEGKGAVRSAVLAERLNMSEDAVNTATHRLRKDYRKILEAEIAATLDDPAEFDDELRALFDALGPESQNR